jgi:hypothetical protein
VRPAAELVVSVVRIVCGFFALVLAARVAFVVFAANPDKWITRFVVEVSDRVTLGLHGLFTPPHPTLAVVAEYGVPAVAWLLIGAVLTGIVRALARRRRV